MNLKNRLSGLLLPPLLLAAGLSACSNRQERAQTAYAEYQAALVGGDLREARRALIALVRADDSNAAYWIELGKVSMQLSDFGTAFEAFGRAHELDRGNVEVLTALTQLALRSGNLDVADEHASRLELVAPSNPAVPLTKGYVALRRGDLDEADRQAAALSEIAPFDGSGKVLQARILMARNQPEAAIALLREQVAKQPSDAESLRSLASIFELREQWGDAATALRGYLNYVPADERAVVRLIEADLRAGQDEAAAGVTLKAIAQNDVDGLLAPWLALGKQRVIADRLFAWAKEADVGRRIATARFFAAIGQPSRVLVLVAPEASLPVSVTNVIPNALAGGAMAETGRVSEGRQRLDAVLQIDGTNREALTARAQLRSRTGDHKGAIEDAQKLAAVDRDSAPGRLLLARTYAAAGDQAGALRTLWEAFHDLGDNRLVFDALLPLVAKSDGAQAAERLSREFYDKRNQTLSRSFA